MSQERLSELAILLIEKEISTKLEEKKRALTTTWLVVILHLKSQENKILNEKKYIK